MRATYQINVCNCCNSEHNMLTIEGRPLTALCPTCVADSANIIVEAQLAELRNMTLEQRIERVERELILRSINKRQINDR
jgi:hypothetical protein